MITRRTFLTGLTATTALVAVPGAAFAMNRPTLADLVENTIKKNQAKLAAEIMRSNAFLQCYNDRSTKNRVKGGLSDFLC